MIHTVQMSGVTWPTSNKELIPKYLAAFTTFINSIGFNKLNYLIYKITRTIRRTHKTFRVKDYIQMRFI
jgi:hypothetical protein